jgi:hypothetical protein
MKTTTRMSLADFKVTKVENGREIEKLSGGAAATCHVYNGEPTNNVDLGGGFYVVHCDHDYGTFPS